MIWTFARNNERTRCEIRRDPDHQDYEFIVTTADGAPEIERFDDPDALIDRSVLCFQALFEGGWRPEPGSHS
ncbi:MAG: hypothetical protein EHM13_13795 [Acidobacteria bacterium]|nr:MAG: hypothetical protein EHM13_13795 [Acidobacteriota bacterium]